MPIVISAYPPPLSVNGLFTGTAGTESAGRELTRAGLGGGLAEKPGGGSLNLP
jgi:hypothetical protein